MRSQLLRTILIALIAALLGYYIGVTKVSFEWNRYKPHFAVSSKEPPPSITNVDFSVFWTVWDKLENNYYDKTALDGKKMLNGAITGMVQSLGDPYTVYLPPVQNTDFKQGLAGQFEGIGAELGQNGKQIVVVSPLDGSPAKKAGVKTGDSILAVDGQSTAGWTLAQTVDKIRGEKGTRVNLTVAHKDETKKVDLAITRDTIQVKSTNVWVKKAKDIEHVTLPKEINGDTQIGYIRVSQFGDNTNKEWLSLANQLELEIKSAKNLKGVILDVRNNPGGYLSDATFIASEFLESGTVVIEDSSIRGRSVYTVSRKGFLTKIPVVILINKGSASASEIVAGALRDHNRAQLIGETSFGKGTIQQAEDLGDGAGLHITIAKWLTPNGTWVHGKGLTPDIAVSLNEKEPDRDTQLEKAVEVLVK